MATKRMGKKEVVSIIEAELRRQAVQGTVSSRLIENYISVRGWRKKKPKGAVQPAPAPEEKTLTELIDEARQLEEASPTAASGPATPPAQEPSPVTTRPAGPPLAPPAPPQAIPPQGVKRGALDILLGIDEEPSQQPVSPLPSPRPQAHLTQVCPVSHFDFADRPVIVTDDHPAPAENGGDSLYW